MQTLKGQAMFMFSLCEPAACMHAQTLESYCLPGSPCTVGNKTDIAAAFKKLKFSEGDGQNNRADEQGRPIVDWVIRSEQPL